MLKICITLLYITFCVTQTKSGKEVEKNKKDGKKSDSPNILKHSQIAFE